jgi:hypothetical protein
MAKTKTICCLFIMNILLVNSCEVFDVADFNFTSGPHSVRYLITPADSGTYFEINSQISSNIDTEIRNKGFSKDDLKSIKINSLTINSLSDSSNFDELDSINLSIEASIFNELQIAWTDSIPIGSTVIKPNYTIEELKDFVIKDKYDIILRGALKATTTDTISIKAEIFYEVLF